jgi:YVTN family beta-propeller protein
MSAMRRAAASVAVLTLIAAGTSLTVSPVAAATDASREATASDLAPSSAAQTAAGWDITPAGRTITATPGQPGLSGPWGVALSPDGQHALVTSSGEAVKLETTEVFDVVTGQRTSVQPYAGTKGQSVFYGVAYSSDGKQAWASGGGQGVVHAYTVAPGGVLVPGPDIKAGFFPAGLAYAVTPRGPRLYVANNLGGPSDPNNTYEDPPGHTVTVIDPAVGRAVATIDLGAALDPLGVTFNRTGTKAYVTNWTGRSVSVIDTARQRLLSTVLLSPRSHALLADHPTGIARNPVRDEVYTANANSDTVSVISTRTDRLVATVDVALVRGAAKGSTPVGLSVSPSGRTLYVADAGENAVAVVDLSTRRTVGFIPTGWYPADLKVSPDGRHLVVVNTYGYGTGPNRCGPFSPLPVSVCPNVKPDYPSGGYYPRAMPESYYIGTMGRGSVQLVDLPGSDPRGASLAAWTAQVRTDNHAVQREAATPAPLRAVKHVIYVIRENRTYDQVFGSLGKGNGDPALNLFGDGSAPNARELARRFVTLDNFYADAQVSQDGHPWSVQGIATDYVNKVWPFDYAWAYYRAYDSEYVPLSQQFASEPLVSDPSLSRSAAAASAGYLWDDAYMHGVSFRDYGEATPSLDATNCHSGKNFSDLTHLQARFGHPVDARFPGWNLDCSDHLVREPEWQREFAGFVAHHNLPSLQLVYLPNDHTQGTYPGTATPASYVADNDLALGQLVAAVSHSPYWASTAIVVLEDDAQDGPDHVDAHRIPALVISPYTQHGTVDSTRYDTVSMLSTIEHLLGLSPMSIYDQRATPMWAAFSATPNLAPYDTLQPAVVPFGAAGYPVNASNAPMGALSATQDFSEPDNPDRHLLSAAIWDSVHPGDPRRGRH